MVKRKRKCSRKQLAALARGRKKRKANLRKKRTRKRKPVRKRKPALKRTKTRNTSTRAIGIMSMAQLTGGTGDVNPQFYSGIMELSGANATTTAAFLSPVAKGIFAKTGKATVMEVLKIFIQMPDWDVIATAGESIDQRAVVFSTKDHGTAQVFIDDPSVFAGWAQERQGAFTAGGTYAFTDDGIYVWDCTDNLGHGLLLATDYFYVQGETNGWTNAATFKFKILYRYKNVKITEYVGIVQSQQ